MTAVLALLLGLVVGWIVGLFTAAYGYEMQKKRGEEDDKHDQF